MPTAYELLKWVHVLLAIVAVGSNATYGIILGRARSDPVALRFALGTVKRIDNFVANPAYGLLFVTGAILVEVGDIGWSTSWIVYALILFGVLVVGGAAVYSPILRRQVRLAESGDTSSAKFQNLTKAGMIAGIALGVIAVAIVYVMVVKP